MEIRPALCGVRDDARASSPPEGRCGDIKEGRSAQILDRPAKFGYDTRSSATLKPLGSVGKGGTDDETTGSEPSGLAVPAEGRGAVARYDVGSANSCGPTGVSTRCARPPFLLPPCRGEPLAIPMLSAWASRAWSRDAAEAPKLGSLLAGDASHWGRPYPTRRLSAGLTFLADIR